MHACLMLNVISGHPVWKHISLHGLVSTDQENEALHVRQENITARKYYFTYVLFT
jgi:hypothetical protein